MRHVIFMKRAVYQTLDEADFEGMSLLRIKRTRSLAVHHLGSFNAWLNIKPPFVPDEFVFGREFLGKYIGHLDAECARRAIEQEFVNE